MIWISHQWIYVSGKAKLSFPFEFKLNYFFDFVLLTTFLSFLVLHRKKNHGLFHDSAEYFVANEHVNNLESFQLVNMHVFISALCNHFSNIVFSREVLSNINGSF